MIVMNGELIEWMTSELRISFHIRSHYLSHFMYSLTGGSCTIYYEPHDVILFVIVIMNKEGFAFHFAISSTFLMRKTDKMGSTWVF